MSRYMVSMSELQFADRDFLPDYMRGPERARRPFGADAAETQRFFAAEDDFDFLCSAASRQDEEASVDLDEVLCGTWAELDADDELSDEEEFDFDLCDDEEERLDAVAEWPAERNELRQVRETWDRAYNRRMSIRRGRNQGRQPRRIHDSRATIRRG